MERTERRNAYISRQHVRASILEKDKEAKGVHMPSNCRKAKSFASLLPQKSGVVIGQMGGGGTFLAVVASGRWEAGDLPVPHLDW